MSWNVRKVLEAHGGGSTGWRAVLKGYWQEVKLAHLRMLELREAQVASAKAAVLRKGNFGADDSSGSIARLADDVPVASLKSDLKRKLALKQVMGPIPGEPKLRDGNHKLSGEGE